MSDQAHDRRQAKRTTVSEAARLLGITEGAVRKRVERGKLAAERTADGRLLVYLDRDTTDATRDTTHDRPRQSRSDRYTRSLEDQVADLRQQLEQRSREAERYQQIIAGLTQANTEQARTIRAIEAPQEAPQEATESDVTVEQDPDREQPRSDAPGAQTGVQRPWWRRMFGR